MNKMLKYFLPTILFMGLLFSQSIQANWQLGAAIVEYTYEVREFDSPEDSAEAGYEVTASWPSSAAAAAGYGYTHTLVEYEVGDTIAVVLVPLINEALLAWQGVGMNVDLNDGGTFTINEGSTYPTTETIDCSTYATVPDVSEAGTWTSTPGFDHTDDPDHPYAHSMGWGISLSSVFAQFGAPDLVNGQYGQDYGVGTDMENWGMVTLDYTDAEHTTPAALEIYWEAHDGTASGLGVNEDGQLNGWTGVPVSPGDTVTIGNMDDYLAWLHPDTSLWYELGWTGDTTLSAPMIGGQGHPIDPENPDSYEIDPIFGDTIPAGLVEVNHGYLFDPVGDDGLPFSGDEPLAPTGYFFTYNFMEAAGWFSGVFEEWFTATNDVNLSATAAADSVAEIYLDDPYADAVAAGVGDTLTAWFNECFAYYGDPMACLDVMEAGPTLTLIGVENACPDEDGCGVDDSGWDYNDYDETGRLVMEVDNNCIPDNTTQRVNTFWGNTQLAMDQDAPIAQKFEVYGNYPNPFNPSTQIKFATEKFSDVQITIYSILGQEVTKLHNGGLDAGTYNISWFGTDHFGNKVPSGVYFYEVRSDNRIQKGKMLLLK
ncbi:MAG: hypothetical protein CMG57_04265 [Candidatus Marinimicrobia bacterium]|nr:hypothetical protein [Candidatus Neomarinimicrobiota bacterium]